MLLLACVVLMAGDEDDADDNIDDDVDALWVCAASLDGSIVRMLKIQVYTSCCYLLTLQ